MKKTICDGCKMEIAYECTTLYARQAGTSKKCDLCALCFKQRLDGINWCPVKPRPQEYGA